ncbi:MAG: thiamine pyrophosphate-dependent enzyme [Planctomycetota bacterium]
MKNPIVKYLREEILPTPFCAGCGCGTVLNLFARAIDEENINPADIVCVTGIGCSSWIPSPYFKCDTLHTTHGRALAFATGIKIMKPHLKVIVIAGDGDIVSIGGNHLIHAARRNIGLSVFLVNNGIYAMTGGQVAPTTPPNVKTATTPYGNPEPPIDPVNLVSAAGATYVARWTTYHVMQLKKAMKEAVQKPGFSFVEIISQCPVSYGKSVGIRSASEFLKIYKEKSIRREKVIETAEKKHKDKIVIGEFVSINRPEFALRLRSLKLQKV